MIKLPMLTENEFSSVFAYLQRKCKRDKTFVCQKQGDVIFMMWTGEIALLQKDDYQAVGDFLARVPYVNQLREIMFDNSVAITREGGRRIYVDFPSKESYFN